MILLHFADMTTFSLIKNASHPAYKQAHLDFAFPFRAPILKKCFCSTFCATARPKIHVHEHNKLLFYFYKCDVSSPHPADRDHSQGEREMGSGTANQSRVNSPAGQW